jgi:hypothetical protein
MSHPATVAPGLADAVAPSLAGPAAGALLAAQFALIWTTFFVLSSTIDWPASLDDPASVALPRLLENEGAVMLGYLAYLMAALLLVPAAAAVNARLGLRGSWAGLLLVLAGLSAIAKAIGITRWLFAMPALARAYVEPGADQGAISLIFETLNAHAGGIGEILGVAVCSGAWTVLAGVGRAGPLRALGAGGRRLRRADRARPVLDHPRRLRRRARALADDHQHLVAVRASRARAVVRGCSLGSALTLASKGTPP